MFEIDAESFKSGMLLIINENSTWLRVYVIVLIEFWVVSFAASSRITRPVVNSSFPPRPRALAPPRDGIILFSGDDIRPWLNGMSTFGRGDLLLLMVARRDTVSFASRGLQQ